MHESEKQKWKQTIRLVACAAVLASLVLFVAQNFLLVEVRFMLFRVHLRLAWALLLAAAVGFLAGYLWPRFRR